MCQESTWEAEVVRWMKDIHLTLVGSGFVYSWVR